MRITGASVGDVTWSEVAPWCLLLNVESREHNYVRQGASAPRGALLRCTVRILQIYFM